jgi:putative oxidoreductase
MARVAFGRSWRQSARREFVQPSHLLVEYRRPLRCYTLASNGRPRQAADDSKGRNAMTAGETKLIYPGLAGFYGSWGDIAYTLVRVIIGYNLFMHGWVKVTEAGLAGVSGYMAKQGLEPSSAFAIAAMVLETVGAACIVLGLFTRFFAAALAIELGIAFLAVHLKAGFYVGKGGYEYVLLLGIVLFFIAIRGGGPYSVDRMIGKEL